MSSWVGETNAVTTQEPEPISVIADLTAGKPPWEINNLLTLGTWKALKTKTWITNKAIEIDGGGTRGYWSLRALQYLMKLVARVEQNRRPDCPVEVHQHSFQPEDYPENVSQTLSQKEMQKRSSAMNDQEKLRALDDTRRYLPCHYFDFIGGSSTGAHPNDPKRCFIDGGFTHVNNPTTEGRLEIEGLFNNASIGTVVSVGTARKGRVSGRGIKQKLETMAGLANNPQKVHNDVLADSNNSSFEYIRLDDPDRLVVEMDEWKPKGSGVRTMEKMGKEFDAWLANIDVQEEFWRCAKLLVAHRRNRIATNRTKWERFATVANYSCRFQQCDRPFMNRDEYRAHLKSDHYYTDSTELEDRVSDCREVWRYQKG
ncbi:MAG: hypothetical protein Q9160_000839 [Pyrenula sp. 1 TL-2023]